MNRISIPTVDQAPAASHPLLAAVNKQLGVVPNLMKLVGNSPAALEGYLSLSGALSNGSLGGPLRERIALAVAEFNDCEYCLAAHTYLGKNLAKLSDEEINAARNADSSDARAKAALHFARRVAAEQGRVTDADLAALKAAGYGDAATVEIVAEVALNILTNYINNVARTTLDFPAAGPKRVA
ncbi:carboxymuconolactone decarboxylase family protein [Duganella violaceipulchra]|uniref:Carboxymuconolactone decarboxylase family protein n=1 Tax=Duganella violaceipulchra TaxID=2849652 RepID=A0AA41HAN5_9BURK|nr:carboxymuconolactone decarboxylase family protein [Duganella violaceicalia]MBV6323774.1 carboxymuconolactone decarboxylase family protein [Duganella violaceicalia]MCP2007464.1 putative peroxidase-related enzyme [Duganella violaceicalia]